MPTLREYVDSSEQEGHYINEKYKNKYITYQVPDFAESILLDFGYGDHDSIPYEVFYILLNMDLIYTGQSGIEPVNSLEELPDFESDGMEPLSAGQRTHFLDMLHEHEGITQQQREELNQYADSKETTEQTENSDTTVERMLDVFSGNSSKSKSKTTDDAGMYDGRIEEYDNYWIHVDLTRFLGKILKESEATANDTDESDLATEYKKYKKKKEESNEMCQQLPGSLPKYKEALGVKDEWQIITKASLEESGIKVSNGDSDLVIQFDFEPYHDDIALPHGYEIPGVWSNTTEKALEDITINDLPEETRIKLLRQARVEIIDDILEAEKSYNNQINSARNEFLRHLKTEKPEDQ